MNEKKKISLQFFPKMAKNDPKMIFKLIFLFNWIFFEKVSPTEPNLILYYRTECIFNDQTKKNTPWPGPKKI